MSTEFGDLVRKWSDDRNLTNGSDPLNQFKKLAEEMFELYGHLIQMHEHGQKTIGQYGGQYGELWREQKAEILAKIKDDVGDVSVVLAVICAQLGLDFEACLCGAWEEIKDRKGRMIDGVFVKEQDLPENQPSTGKSAE